MFYHGLCKYVFDKKAGETIVSKTIVSKTICYQICIEPSLCGHRRLKWVFWQLCKGFSFRQIPFFFLYAIISDRFTTTKDESAFFFRCHRSSRTRNIKLFEVFDPSGKMFFHFVTSNSQSK